MKFSLIKEFKEFAVKGNMIDIAIGVIIGAAFNKVVDVLVKEIFLPPLSFLSDGGNFEFVPELKFKYSYFIVWVIMILISLGMLLYFKKKKWLYSYYIITGHLKCPVNELDQIIINRLHYGTNFSAHLQQKRAPFSCSSLPQRLHSVWSMRARFFCSMNSAETMPVGTASTA